MSFSSRRGFFPKPEKMVQIIRFCIVGAMNYLVDLGAFNLLRAYLLQTHPLTAKTIAVGIATLFSWVINRQWTFRAQRTASRGRELAGFVAVNILGMFPALLCLWVSHYLLGLTSLLADNISANVVGLILGTILRYVCYDRLVFTGKNNAVARKLSAD